MSSYPYLMAVSVRTENKGTAVVTAEREEISGMSWNPKPSVSAVKTCFFLPVE